MTKKYIKTMLAKMCVIDKATWLNLLRKEKYPGTTLESNINIKIIACDCNYEKTYMILDSLIWRLYGLFYKDYTFRGPGFPIFDPIMWESACDKAILHYATDNQ